jgi:formylglycine-generating enzyme required for sulfatase activity
MYLVTVSRFRLFVTAWSGGYEPPPGSGRHSHLDADAGLLAAGDSGASHETGWLSAYDGLLTPTSANLACDTASATWTEQPGPHDSLPINCASWYEAYAFCVWDGGFLPSEAEWEYAAVAGSQQRTYPWGTAAPGAGVDYAVFGCLYDGAGTCTGIQNIAPVGSCDAGAGLWGQLDLAGEAWEWTLDVYSETYALPCTDCAYLGPATARVIRGGGFDTSASRIGAAVRDSSDPKGRAKDVGVRCARVP